jgi:hypothetical protein
MRSVKKLSEAALNGADGREWYRFANDQINAAAASLGISPKRLADLLAVFSPRVSVTRSIKWTLHYVKTGQTLPDCTRSHRAALLHYETTGEIRGPKTGPFAKALLGDTGAVVLDVWMARALAIPQKKLESVKVWAQAYDRVLRVAGSLGWTPAETQAAIWTATVRGAGRNPPAFDIVSHL